MSGNILGAAFERYGLGSGSMPGTPAAQAKNPDAEYEYGQRGRTGVDTDGNGLREVDCSVLVYNALRNAGYYLPGTSAAGFTTQTLFRGNTLTQVAQDNFSEFKPADILAGTANLKRGDILLFGGANGSSTQHTGIFYGYDSARNPMFYGAQSSTGPGIVTVHLNNGEKDAVSYWNGGRFELVGALRPKESLYVPEMDLTGGAGNGLGSANVVAAVNLLKQEGVEGFRPNIYSNADGVPTVGNGLALVVKGTNGWVVRPENEIKDLLRDAGLPESRYNDLPLDKLTNSASLLNAGNNADAKAAFGSGEAGGFTLTSREADLLSAAYVVREVVPKVVTSVGGAQNFDHFTEGEFAAVASKVYQSPGWVNRNPEFLDAWWADDKAAAQAILGGGLRGTAEAQAYVGIVSTTNPNLSSGSGPIAQLPNPSVLQPTPAPYPGDGTIERNPDGSFELGFTAKIDDPKGNFRQGDYVYQEFNEAGQPVGITVWHKDNTVSQDLTYTDSATGETYRTTTVWDADGTKQVQTTIDRQGNVVGDRISGGVTWHLEGEGADRRYVDPNGRTATEREADGIAASDARFNGGVILVGALDPTNPGGINAVNGHDLNSDQYQPPSPGGASTAPELTPDLTQDQVNDLRETLGLAPAPTPGPGTHYANNTYGNNNTVTDAGAGVASPEAPAAPSAPVATPPAAPVYTTLRANQNTVFTLNEEGDIVSETVTGLGGYTNTRLNTGERSYTDANGSPITQQQYEQYQADARAVDRAATTAAGTVGFINAMAGLRNWDDMSDIQRLSALTGVISQANALSGGALAGDLGISGSALQGAGAALGFLAAAERGDTAGMIINGTSFADAVSGQAVSTAIGNAIGVNAAAVIPGLNLIAALANGDGMAIGSTAMTTVLAAMQTFPIAGQVLAAFMIVGSVLTGKDEPLQQHGNAQAQWGDQGELDYGLQYDEGAGGKTAQKYAAELMKGLQDAVSQQPELAVIPERVPRVGWVLEPGQDNQDRVYLEWFDDSGQRHTRWYTDEGQPQPNRHGEAPGVKDLASDFVEIALSQGAIAPAAEAAELRQNWIEAMAPVVALQAQIAELDKLAEPVRPFQRMEGQQGLIWYDSVSPLRLAELENQMAPLQQQAKELRAQAKAQFDEELKGLEGVDAVAVAGNAPQTQAQLQLTKEVLTDGSGTLYTMKDGQGNETKLLDANNARDYDGKAEHRGALTEQRNTVQMVQQWTDKASPATAELMLIVRSVAGGPTIANCHRKVTRAVKHRRNQHRLTAFALSMPDTTALQGFAE